MNNEINVVIGSWGSYNACNERALGSRWLNFADYSDWDEIADELVSQGYILDGIDEELFVQDVENLPSTCANWNDIHPQRLFNALSGADVLQDSNKYDILLAFLELRSLSDFFELVDSKGRDWDDDISVCVGFDWEQYGRELFTCYSHELPSELQDFFDFEGYGKYMADGYAEEYSGGIIEIRD